MIKDNILKVRERIAAVCAKSSRDPDSVTIVAVTKNRPVEEIKEAITAGLPDIGENRVQEALIKYNELTNLRTYERIALKWHMVGHLQTNKVKDALKLFDLIHSVDSLDLAQEIDRQAAKINKVQEVLIELNSSGESSKFGLKPDGVVEVIKEIFKLKNVNIKGLMTIAPIVDDPQKARPYFRMLRELRDEICKLSTINYRLSTLSMGMTGDFEVAIEEGATMVRLGRAIFESSP